MPIAGRLKFDEAIDDDEVITKLFKALDTDNSGTISKKEVDDYLQAVKGQEELVQALKKMIDEHPLMEIGYDAFRKSIQQIPRVLGQRVQWACTLGLEAELARFLKPGTIFDGLKGIRDEMTLDDINEACAKLSAKIPDLVIQGWNTLKQRKVVSAETANSKFAMTEGAIVGAFGDLELFYKGPEAHIGYPNPKLYEAMTNEHTRRPNAQMLFTAPNYGVTSCADWEWNWVIDPFQPLSPSLKQRISSKHTYPGEEGDSYTESKVEFTIRALTQEAAAFFAEKLATGLDDVFLESLTEDAEELSRGVRVVESAAAEDKDVVMAIAMPVDKERMTCLADKFCQAIACLIRADPGDIAISNITESTFEYCEFVDIQHLKLGLEAKSRTSLDEYALHAWKIPADSAREPKTCIEMICAKYQQQTEEWKQHGKLRKQGRVRRDGSINDVMRLQQSGLRKEEVIALRLYTGPMYLNYNASLRQSPAKILSLLGDNRFETTIFVIISGLVKVSKMTKLPANRMLYRGLGGMLLPDQFWKPSLGLQGGVELGLMSTTTDRDIAIQYSGREHKRAIIFEILAGRIDIGASLAFVSQYPGEVEFLMPPLTCLEVMGKPRVDMTDKGEVIVFPMRANVNLKSMTVEQLEQRRKELHVAMVKNLQDDLFLWLEAAKSDFTRSLTESNAAKRVADVAAQLMRQDLFASAVVSVKKEFEVIHKRHSSIEPTAFNDEHKYKEYIVEVIDSKLLATQKVQFFRQEIEEKGAERNSVLHARILSTPLGDFSKSGIALALRTGATSFPWHDVVEGKVNVDLGEWTPEGIDDATLNNIRTVLASNKVMRGVTSRGKVIPLQGGILSPSINLDKQPVKEVIPVVVFLLSVNTGLRELSLRSNGLDVADWCSILGGLSSCRSLSMINCHPWTTKILQVDGELKAFDIRNCVISIEEANLLSALLRCRTPSLTALNLSNCALGMDGGKAIAQSLGFLSSLTCCDLSGQELGDSVWLLLAALINKLSSLSISKGMITGTSALDGRGLVRLELSAPKQLNAQETGRLAGVLMQPTSPNLLALDLSDNDIMDDGCTSIAMALTKLSSLKALILRRCSIASKGAKSLAESLCTLHSITTCDLRDNRLETIDWQPVLKALSLSLSEIDCERQQNLIAGQLVDLDLVKKQITFETAKELSLWMPRSASTLSSLNLSNTGLENGTYEILGSCLSHLTSLRSVDLRGNRLTSPQWQYILGQLRPCCLLEEVNGFSWSKDVLLMHRKEIDLACKGIGVVGGAVVGAFIPRSADNLELLNLRDNDLGPDGMAFISSSLPVLTKLKLLNLRGNNLDALAGTDVAESLPLLTCLHTLDLSNNDMQDTGVTAIVEGLYSSLLLQSLDLGNNAVKGESWHSIVLMLDPCTCLTLLNGYEWTSRILQGGIGCFDHSGNKIVGEEAWVMSALLGHRASQLTQLNLSDCSLGEEDARAIAQCIKRLPCWTSCHLSGQDFGEGVFELVEALGEGLSSLSILFGAVTGRSTRRPGGTVRIDLGSLSQIGPAAAAKLGKALASSCGRQLTEVDLRDNAMLPEGATHIAAALPHLSALTAISLRNCGIGPEGGRAVAESLSKVPSITVCDLRDNGLGAAEWAVVLAALAVSLTDVEPTVQESLVAGGAMLLDLAGRPLPPDTLRQLAALLPRSAATLTALNLSNTGLGKESCEIMTKCLCTLTSLRSIDIRGNEVSAGDMYSLLCGTSGCKDLERVNGYGWCKALLPRSVARADLSARGMGAVEAAAAAALVQRSASSLTLLDMCQNRLGEEGASVLHRTLRMLTCLVTLNLWGNELGAVGVAHVLKSLRNVHCLTLLDLDYNDMGPEGGKIVGGALSSLASLLTLNLMYPPYPLDTRTLKRNRLGPEGGTAVGLGLRSLTALQTLDIWRNQLGTSGCIAIAEGLRLTTSLRTLDLQHNDIDTVGRARVKSLLPSVAQLFL